MDLEVLVLLSMTVLDTDMVGKWAVQGDASGFIMLSNYILFICELDHSTALEITTPQIPQTLKIV